MKTKIYVYIIWFQKKQSSQNSNITFLKIFLNNTKYSFEVIKYSIYIYIFLDEKHKFVYNVILLKKFTQIILILEKNNISFKT